MKNQNYKYLLLGVSAGLFLSTSAFAGFEFNAPVVQEARPVIRDGNDGLLPVVIEEGESLPPIISQPVIASPIDRSVPVTAPAPSMRSQEQDYSDYAMAVGFGSDLPLVTALSQIIPVGYTYSFETGVNAGQNVSWNGGREWPVVLNDMLDPLGLDSTIGANQVSIHKKKAVLPGENLLRSAAEVAVPKSADEVTEPVEVVKTAAVFPAQQEKTGAQGTYIHPAPAVMNDVVVPVDTSNARQTLRDKIQWDDEPLSQSVTTPRAQGPQLTASYADEVSVDEAVIVEQEEVSVAVKPVANDIRWDEPKETVIAIEKTETEITPDDIAVDAADVPVDMPLQKEEIQWNEGVVGKTPAPAAKTASSTDTERRSLPVLEDTSDLKYDYQSKANSPALKTQGASYDVEEPVVAKATVSAVAPASVSRASEVPVKAEEVQIDNIVNDLLDSAPQKVVESESKKWAAPKGTSLKTLLQDWSNREDVALVWSSDYDYIVSNNMNLDGSYAEAVKTVLESFAGKAPSPMATYHPNNGSPVLVIKNNRG